MGEMRVRGLDVCRRSLGRFGSRWNYLRAEMHRRLESEEQIPFKRISDYELDKNEPSLMTVMASYARVAGVHMEDLVDDELDLPAKLPGNVRYQGLKRKATLESKEVIPRHQQFTSGLMLYSRTFARRALRMNVSEFVAKWRKVELTERSSLAATFPRSVRNIQSPKAGFRRPDWPNLHLRERRCQTWWGPGFGRCLEKGILWLGIQRQAQGSRGGLRSVARSIAKLSKSAPASCL